MEISQPIPILCVLIIQVNLNAYYKLDLFIFETILIKSGNYLSDFVNTFSANVSLVGDLVFENSNVESCSALCVTADGLNCTRYCT